MGWERVNVNAISMISSRVSEEITLAIIMASLTTRL